MDNNFRHYTLLTQEERCREEERHHKPVVPSLDTIEARNSWREFFVQVVNDNGIAHLDGVEILDDPTPIYLPRNIALKRGGVQTILAGHFAPKKYLDPSPTFEVVIDACNEALGSKLTVDQIANRFIDLIPAIPPRLVGKSRW